MSRRIGLTKGEAPLAMSDTKTVREACKHGRYETHPNISYGDVPVEDNCAGGKEITLRYADVTPAWAEGHPVWVEVDDNDT